MRRMMRIGRGAALALACALVGCGAPAPPSTPPDQPFVLNATAGTWSDGSGRMGLALLATLRDDHGAGPDSAWMGSLLDPSGATLASGFSYDDGAPGSVAVWWWPEVPTSPRDHYTLTLEARQAVVLITKTTEPISPDVDFALGTLVDDAFCAS